MTSISQHGFSGNDQMQSNRAIEDPVGPLLRIEDVCAETGLSRATIYRLINELDNPFPKQIKVGNAALWSLVEIIGWKKRAIARRDR